MATRITRAVLPPGKYYIGDVCYVLDEEHYNTWDRQGFNNGLVKIEDVGSFAVAKTAWGDGCYTGTDKVQYGVDAGNIGLVPLHMCAKGEEWAAGMGAVYEFVDHDVVFTYSAGVFRIKGANHFIRINSGR